MIKLSFFYLFLLRVTRLGITKVFDSPLFADEEDEADKDSDDSDDDDAELVDDVDEQVSVE